MLSAVIWSWFAASESHNRLSQNQAGIVENPGLSYGLFHASVSPIYSWGVARKVGFPGVNMDIAHVRNLTWAKDSDKSTWVNYNRMRGQYMSGLEASVPEQFFNNPAQCDLAGTNNPVAGLPDCPQGISAVKAIGLAAAQGQKIYTITQSVYQANPNIVSSNLAAHSQSTQDKVQQALDTGYEVMIHEAPIVQDGWIGSGFNLIDPSTGAGGYLINGGSNGGVLLLDVLKGAAGGAMLALATLAIPLQILLLINGFLLPAFLTGLLGAAFVAGVVSIGVDPVIVALFRVTVATVLAFNVLAFGPAAVVGPIALGVFIIWMLASIVIETVLLLSFRK